MTHDRNTDDLLIAGIAAGLNYTATGELAGRSAKTVQRRMADPDFAAAVAAARTARIDRIVGELADLGSTAVAVIREAMDPAEPTRTRLTAATTSLRQLRDFRSAAELERRLVEVEELAARLSAADEEANSNGHR